MRILMLNNEFPPLGGGTATVNKAILDQLRGVEGVYIDLVTSALGHEREEEAYSDRIRVVKLPVNSRNMHHASVRQLLVYAWKTLRESRRRHRFQPYDFCFAWSAVPAGWVALQLKRSQGLRYLVRVCGVDIPGFERRYRFIYPAITPVIRAVWREAECVIAKCRGEVDLIQRADPTVSPQIIPNGVDLRMFAPPAGKLAHGNLRVICVGRLIERKGQRTLIEAAARLRQDGVDVEVELVGTGDAESAYRRLVVQKGLESRVHFSGYVSREDVGHHFQNADVFVLPSVNEGMSVSTLEAMAAGLPLIVTDTGGTEELVETGENGFVFAPRDVAALVNRLRQLAGNRDLVDSMGIASRRKAARFSWNAARDRYLELFGVLSSQGQHVAAV